MDRLQAMRVFTRVVELGSFTKAADDLNLPRATVTYAIKELETRLAAKLLNRTTRQVNVTADGEAYYRRCVRLLADLEETESVFRHATSNPKGKLRVTMGSQAQHFVLPYLSAFCEKYPGIDLEIDIADRFVDLVREGVDCAVRSGELRDSSLYGRRIAKLEQITCASPAYLARHGTPLHPDDLQHGHLAVNFFSSQTGRVMPFEFTFDGTVKDQTLPGKIAVNGVDAYKSACLSGFGLVQMPRYGAEKELAEGRLVEVLHDFHPPAMPVSVLYPHQLQLTPRVRVFVEWVAERYAAAR
ncbi:MAG TPA: LysR family transcriptional regulator [Oxalicibacterium sp.]|jgi:DNA-binding transcriptional LysR family regulator|nr:LysR family transcriptional regulator [Oxalicibacterium sp.]